MVNFIKPVLSHVSTNLKQNFECAIIELNGMEKQERATVNSRQRPG
jgi:hypothetical protein